VEALEQVIILPSDRFGGTKGIDPSCFDSAGFPDFLFGDL